MTVEQIHIQVAGTSMKTNLAKWILTLLWLASINPRDHLRALIAIAGDQDRNGD